jgi:hypothetical protein
MDGNISNNDNDLPSPDRREPALYFWVHFGLAFEALCSSTSYTSTTNLQVELIALEAIIGLVRPDIAGNVLLDDDEIFDQVCNLCFRLVLTDQGLEIKMRVLEIVFELVRVFIKEVHKKKKNNKNPSSQ